MKVCHFADLQGVLEGGQKTSVRQQRKALDISGVEYTTDPSEPHDVLHLNVLGPRCLYHLHRALKNGTPVVVHAHNSGEDFRQSFRLSNQLAPLVDRYMNVFYRKADRIVAPSEYTKDVLEGKSIDTPVEVVSNGVDTERLEGCDESREGEFTALNLGMRIERKGLSDFVETGRRSDIQFKWYGPELNRLVQARKARRTMEDSPENVSFPGYIEDVKDAFREADVFFFPTRHENQGIALLEAAYCGLPLVVRDISTYEGWLEHGENCLKADSLDGFIEHLERLEEDKELRERLGENAREMAEDHTLEKVGERLEGVYQEVEGG
ncbi:MAG: glycosyltransferase [Candidatus Nanohaloarchaeota archaeon QJJ-7]|nr:glycosyltransferase [Candidatus Nanohaloarchaeota archaeon QJJ-7]